MKSDRRHELDTNVLAVRLNEWIEKIRPYSRVILILLIVVIGGAIISAYLTMSATAERQRGWGEFTYALTSYPPHVDALEEAAKDFPGTPMEVWSKLTWADYQIAGASGVFFRNRSEAEKQIKSALAIYESLTDDETSELLRERAKLGMARALELKGDVEKAREAYEQVGGPFVEIAKARSLALAEPDTEKKFAWLTQAVATTPRPPAGPGRPGEKPLFGTDFSPAPPEEPATSDADATAPDETAPDATQPEPDSEPADDNPVDFSFEESEPDSEPAAETDDSPDKTAE